MILARCFQLFFDSFLKALNLFFELLLAADKNKYVAEHEDPYYGKYGKKIPDVFH
jgi:hypothetical protein